MTCRSGVHTCAAPSGQSAPTDCPGECAGIPGGGGARDRGVWPLPPGDSRIGAGAGVGWVLT